MECRSTWEFRSFARDYKDLNALGWSKASGSNWMVG